MMRSLPITLLVTITLSAIAATTTAANVHDQISLSKLSKYDRDLSRDSFLPSEKNVEDLPTNSPTLTPTASPTYTPTKSPIVLAIDESDTDTGGIGTDRGSERANGSISAAPFIAIGAVAFVIAGAYIQRKYKGGANANGVQNSISDDDGQYL
jgi:hypothetical protein